MTMSNDKIEGLNDFYSPRRYGYYKLVGIRKMLFKLAQLLPKNIFGFKIALLLRKITLQNKIKIIDQTQFELRLRLFPMDNCLAKWERILNKLMNTPVDKDWIIDGFKKNIQKDFRTYNNRPDWKAINRVANNLWQYHYPKI